MSGLTDKFQNLPDIPNDFLFCDNGKDLYFMLLNEGDPITVADLKALVESHDRLEKQLHELQKKTKTISIEPPS